MFVLFVFIFSLVNFGLQIVELLKIAFVFFSAEERFLHDVFEFDLKTVSVLTGFVYSLTNVFIGDGCILKLPSLVLKVDSLGLGLLELLVECVFVVFAS